MKYGTYSPDMQALQTRWFTCFSKKRAIIEFLLNALNEIKNNQGHVCGEFEICTHESCRSSHASWEIASAALDKIPDRLMNRCSNCGEWLANKSWGWKCPNCGKEGLK